MFNGVGWQLEAGWIWMDLDGRCLIAGAVLQGGGEPDHSACHTRPSQAKSNFESCDILRLATQEPTLRQLKRLSRVSLAANPSKRDICDHLCTFTNPRRASMDKCFIVFHSVSSAMCPLCYGLLVLAHSQRRSVRWNESQVPLVDEEDLGKALHSSAVLPHSSVTFVCICMHLYAFVCILLHPRRPRGPDPKQLDFPRPLCVAANRYNLPWLPLKWSRQRSFAVSQRL